MKQLILLTVLMFSIIQCLFSQTRTPYSFDGYTPLWSHYVQGEGFPDSIRDYLALTWPSTRNGELLEYENSLYLVNNIEDSRWLHGYNIERVDVDTGEEIWDFTVFNNTLENREFAYYPYIEYNEFHLMIYKENRPDQFNPFWKKSNAGKRVFDIETGKLIDSLGTDKYDSKNFLLEIPYFWTNFHSVNSRLYPSVDDGYVYIDQSISNNNSQYNYIYSRFQLDAFGHQVGDVITHERVLGQNRYYGLNWELENDMIFSSFQFAVDIDTNGQDVLQSNFEILDRELNVIQEGKLCDGSCFVVDVDSDSYLISNKFGNDELYNLNFRLLDMAGNEIENLSLEIENYVTSMAIKIDSISILVCVQTEEAGYDVFSFYKSVGSNEAIMTKSLMVNDSTDHLFLYGLFQVKNGNIMVRFSHKDLESTFSDPPNWVNFTMFSYESLGLLTGMENVPVRRNDVLVFPNPTSGRIKIELDDKTKARTIHILNIDRRLVKDIDFVSNVDISDLPTGIYFMEIFDDERMLVGSNKIVIE